VSRIGAYRLPIQHLARGPTVLDHTWNKKFHSCERQARSPLSSLHSFGAEVVRMSLPARVDSTRPVRLEVNEVFTAGVVLVAQALDVFGLHGGPSPGTLKRSVMPRLFLGPSSLRVTTFSEFPGEHDPPATVRCPTR
jgi:hypothetical protein